MLSAALIMITLVNCGAILQQRKWIFYLEYTRYLLILILVVGYLPSIKLFLLVALATGVTVAYFKTLQRYYLGVVYRNRVKADVG